MTAPLSPLQRRPFPTVQSLSPGDRNETTKQRIPSLEQALEAAKQSNISIMFDLRPENHSDYQNFVNVTLGVILQSGIPLQQVSWSPPHPCQALLSHPCLVGGALPATQSIPDTPYTTSPYVIPAGQPCPGVGFSSWEKLPIIRV